ncbi:MAG: hypothetical protein K8Q91_03260 [Candidatus Vogelbacteria bacterium]|nr:hypothetical protein [Candidatus Vogelbacteria bacterium]
MMNNHKAMVSLGPSPTSDLVDKAIADVEKSKQANLNLDRHIKQGLGNLGTQSNTLAWIDVRGVIVFDNETGILTIPVKNDFCARWCREHREVQGDITLCLPDGFQFKKMEFVETGIPDTPEPNTSLEARSEPEPGDPIQEVFDFGANKSTVKFNPGKENLKTYDLVKCILDRETDFPLMVLWGENGTGKETLANQVYRRGTRLLAGLAQKRKTPQTAIVSAIGFQAEFVACFRDAKDGKKALQVLQDRLLVRLLVITDLDTFCGRNNQGTADALSQAVTKVIDSGGRVLVTMSVPEGGTYEETLGKINPTIVQLLGTKGFADFLIKPASLETRVEILSQLRGPNMETLSEDSRKILATQWPTVASMLTQGKKFLHGIVDEEPRKETPSPPKIIEAIESWSQLPKGSLVGRSKTRRVVQGRHLAIYLVAELHPKMTAATIGKLFGNRDHTTVLYAKQQVSMNIDLQDSLEAARKLFT